ERLGLEAVEAVERPPVIEVASQRVELPEQHFPVLQLFERTGRLQVLERLAEGTEGRVAGAGVVGLLKLELIGAGPAQADVGRQGGAVARGPADDRPEQGEISGAACPPRGALAQAPTVLGLREAALGPEVI